MPRKINPVPVSYHAHVPRSVQTKDDAGIGIKKVAYDNRSTISHCDETSIEGSIKMGCQKDAVVDI